MRQINNVIGYNIIKNKIKPTNTNIMKTKLLFLASFLFVSLFSITAQNEINNLNLLKSELDTISKQKLPINSVALNQNGDWIILYGDIGYSFVTMPGKLSSRLDTLNKQQKVVKDIDFTGKSGWVLLAQQNAFYSDSLPAKMLAGLKKINLKGQEIKSVDAYGENSGV